MRSALGSYAIAHHFPERHFTASGSMSVAVLQSISGENISTGATSRFIRSTYLTMYDLFGFGVTFRQTARRRSIMKLMYPLESPVALRFHKPG